MPSASQCQTSTCAPASGVQARSRTVLTASVSSNGVPALTSPVSGSARMSERSSIPSTKYGPSICSGRTTQPGARAPGAAVYQPGSQRSVTRARPDAPSAARASRRPSTRPVGRSSWSMRPSGIGYRYVQPAGTVRQAATPRARERSDVGPLAALRGIGRNLLVLVLRIVRRVHVGHGERTHRAHRDDGGSLGHAVVVLLGRNRPLVAGLERLGLRQVQRIPHADQEGPLL